MPALASAVRWKRIMAKFTLALMILNCTLILPPTLQFYNDTTQTIDRQVNTMITTCGKGRYAIVMNDGYHYEQFLSGYGITGFYPEESAVKKHKKGEFFPLGSGDYAAFTYKEDCVKH
jgi:hypothetical protein